MERVNELRIRPETGADVEEVRDVVTQAFAGVEHSTGTEAAIIDALRAEGALSVSLVAVRDGEVIGHVAASPVKISSGTDGWFGIGPVAVRPERQGGGVGSTLMRRAVETLRRHGAAGAVLLGEPGFYSRFGFRTVPGLTYPGAPAEYFLALPFADGPPPQGEVTYHRAFDVPPPELR